MASRKKTADETIESWGGKRSGSGRRRLMEKPVRRTITLSAHDVATLLVIGEGNASEGVRRVIAAYVSQTDH